PELQKQRTMIVNQAITQFKRQKADEAYVPVIKAAINRGLDVAEGFMQNTNAVTYGLSLADDGIKATVLADFVPGSYPANIVAKVKSTNESLLTGLPQQKYIFFGGAQVDSATVNQLIDDLINPIRAEAEKSGDKLKPALQYIDAFKVYITAE